MAKNKGRGTAPPDVPGGNISEFGSDSGRIVIQELSRVSTQIENLTNNVKDLQNEVKQLNAQSIRLDTSLKVGGAAVGLFLTAFWFMFGSHIDKAVQNALREVVLQKQSTSIANTPQNPD